MSPPVPVRRLRGSGPAVSASRVPRPATSVARRLGPFLCLFILLLTGCTAGAERTPEPSLPTASPSSPATSSPRPSGGVGLRVTGTVQAGVEPGCLLLAVADDDTYLLLGEAARDLEPGARVRVTGVPQPDAITFCQQGTPLQVSQVEPIA